jgi:hypothetical protein
MRAVSSAASPVPVTATSMSAVQTTSLVSPASIRWARIAPASSARAR